MNLPNALTVARIGIAPVLFALILMEGYGSGLIAFVLFVTAGLSDLWDGHIARSRGEITDFGKLADPIADKLLVAATFIPLYIVSHRGPNVESIAAVPWWGTLPLWVVLVILGREFVITVLRTYAQRRGIVMSARREGKFKTLSQNLFIGSLILWLALRSRAIEQDWTGALWSFWKAFHGAFVAIALGIAVVLTAYSLAVYLSRYRRIISGQPI